jgi:hypothetical protein
VAIRLVIEVAQGGALERRLRDQPPAPVASGEAVVIPLPAGPDGEPLPLEPGQIVLSVPAPEALAREPEDVHRVIDEASPGAAPLVVEVVAAEELLEEQLAVVLDAARHTTRNVILRVADAPAPEAG